VRQRSAEHDEEFADSLLSGRHGHDTDHADPAGRPSPRPRRSDRHARSRQRGHRRVLWVFAGLFVVVVVLVSWLVVVPIYHHFTTSDYSGSGTGSVRVTVVANDAASDIAAELKAKGVVKSTGAFVHAADDNSDSRSIQPGTYVLRKHMSGVSALDLMLDPKSRVDDDVVVTEGATTLDVGRRLSAQPCSSDSDASAVCGPGYPSASVTAAMADVSALGIPPAFEVKGKAPASVEGFLYPAKYFFPEDGKPVSALQQMITQFAEQVRGTDFTSQAKANGFTAYQQLVVASIAQSEAKYPADMAKVARVIMNRIAGDTPLKIDATSAYAAKLKGQDPTKVIYATIDSPYNTYTHDGLPPTPISNPGADALDAAAHPAKGNWLFYVNKDKAGHLFFTNSETAFVQAVAKCRANNWGCG